MEVTASNDVKVYNLSAGKTLPEWISDRKKRTLLKNDIDLRRRIELLQDFNMPVASTGVGVSSDGQYIFAAGIYKPRVRCYDVSHLSMKFERCIDAEVVNFSILSENYSKFVLLLANRQLEFHSQFGFYYRTRVPKFGRSLAYHLDSCDLYVTAEGSEIFRLNLEQGKFLTPLVTKATGSNASQFNTHHQLLTVGTDEGTVECWDPRSRGRVGELPLAMAGLHHFERDVVPAVTALSYKDAMHLAIGTASGQVLLYDLRSPHPYLVKDHLYSAPIHSISFQAKEDLVLSADSKILKIWKECDGSTYTSIEPAHDITQMCHLPDTGMVLLAMDDPKMLAYYIPSVGVAPRWCSFLDNLTEELEEDPEPTVYQDYKFVTTKDLDELGLSHLLGTNLLRGYMHGYFMDMKLYHKARAVAQPFAYETYRKERIQKKIKESRASKINVKKLPRINRELAVRLSEKKPAEAGEGPLGDQRFAALFTDEAFQIDKESEEYQKLHPLLSRSHRGKKEEDAEVEELEGKVSDGESSSDDEIWKQVRRDARERRHLANQSAVVTTNPKQPRTALSAPATTKPQTKSLSRALGQRLKKVGMADGGETSSALGSKEHKFIIHKNDPYAEERQRHKTERRKVRRSATSLLTKKRQQAVYWRGRRIK